MVTATYPCCLSYSPGPQVALVFDCPSLSIRSLRAVRATKVATTPPARYHLAVADDGRSYLYCSVCALDACLRHFEERSGRGGA